MMAGAGLPTATRHVGLSLGTIDSLTDGLGEFSTQLCERIAALAPRWQAQHGVRFHLHLRRAWHGRFGADVGYLGAHKLQGHWHLQPRRRFDVWHGLNQLGRIGPPWGTRHALLTIHDLNPIYHAPPPAARKALHKLGSRLRKFDEVTTLTRHVEGDIRSHLKWAGPVSVIANGARDLTTHAQQPVDSLAPGGFLLHLSRLAESKNPPALLDLAAAWPAQTLVLAGPPGRDADRVQAHVQARGLRNVHLVQNVSDAQKTWLYAHCRAFVFPSLAEGFGLPPLEAMHFGKPVFLARRTSLPEIGGDRAAYFGDFDGLRMRQVIERHLPRLQSEAGTIRAHARQFSWDRAAQAYVAIYQRLLGIDAAAL